MNCWRHPEDRQCLGRPGTAVVTTVAPRRSRLPREARLHITRTYYSMDGEEVNPSEVTQNERYVVVLNVVPQNNWQSRILVTDLLPSGFEIDNPSLVNSAALRISMVAGDGSGTYRIPLRPFRRGL